MNNFKRDLAVQAVKALDAALLTLPFLFCWFFCYADRTASPFHSEGNWIAALLFLILYVDLWTASGAA